MHEFTVAGAQSGSYNTGPDVRFLYRYSPRRTPKLRPCWWTIAPFTLCGLFTLFACFTRSHDLWGALALLAFAAYAVLREPQRSGMAARVPTSGERQVCDRS